MSAQQQEHTTPKIHGLQPVDPTKRPQEAAEECAREVNVLLQRYGCVVVSRPNFVPDGIGGFRLVIETNIVSK